MGISVGKTEKAPAACAQAFGVINKGKRRAACLVAFAALGVLPGPGTARADSTVDSAVCLSSGTGTLSFSVPTFTWGDDPGVLKWSTNVPTACATAGGGLVLLRNGKPYVDPNSGAVYRAFNSSITTPSLPGTWNWTLRIETAQGYKDLASATVTVNLPGALTDGATDVTITSNTVDQRRRFVQAVQTPNVTVHIAGDVDLDLSYVESLPVAPGVSILGDRSIVRSGPRVFTTTFPRYMFVIGRYSPSDNVHISGIRLDGGESDDPFSAVGMPEADGVAVFASIGVEIDHSEIYRWRGSGVSVHDGNDANKPDYVGRINKENADAVWVHDNYIHHNQHPSSNYCGSGPFDGGGHAAGYGVQAADGAYVKIERNVFDWNRHSIAGDGKTGTGYYAYDNLILANGGVHFRCPSPGDGIDLLLNPFATIAKVIAEVLDDDMIYHTHAIDMHGVNTCKSLLVLGGDHNCGPAGEYMEIEFNTILYTAGNGVHLRGTPKQAMYLLNNVFAHKDHDGSFVTPGAMVQNELGLYDAGTTLGLNTFNDRKQCDFDGDGINDDFIATGVTWWYASSAQGGRWTFLNRSTARVADVTLGDFDGDGRCDVSVAGKVFPNPDPLVFAHSPGHVSTSYNSFVNLQLRAAGGSLPWSWAVSGLPPGMSANAAGLISGKPMSNAVSDFTVTATVTDAKQKSNTVTFEWTLATTVPNVLSLSEAAAQANIAGAGLSMGKVSTLNNCVDPGSVMTQNPMGGVASPLGTPVNITVSTCAPVRGVGHPNPILPK